MVLWSYTFPCFCLVHCFLLLLAGYRLWIALKRFLAHCQCRCCLWGTRVGVKLRSARFGGDWWRGWGIYIKKRSQHDSFVVLLTFITLIRAIANANHHLAVIMVQYGLIQKVFSSQFSLAREEIKAMYLHLLYLIKMHF